MSALDIPPSLREQSSGGIRYEIQKDRLTVRYRMKSGIETIFHIIKQPPEKRTKNWLDQYIPTLIKDPERAQIKQKFFEAFPDANK